MGKLLRFTVLWYRQLNWQNQGRFARSNSLADSVRFRVPERKTTTLPLFLCRQIRSCTNCSGASLGTQSSVISVKCPESGGISVTSSKESISYNGGIIHKNTEKYSITH